MKKHDSTFQIRDLEQRAEGNKAVLQVHQEMLRVVVGGTRREGRHLVRHRLIPTSARRSMTPPIRHIGFWVFYVIGVSLLATAGCKAASSGAGEATSAVPSRVNDAQALALRATA